MSSQVEQVTPVLRVFDVPLALTFYVDYVGCSLDWQVSNGSLVLHLSTHHGDGTPGGVVLVEVHDIKDLHRTLHSKGYRFMNLDSTRPRRALRRRPCRRAGRAPLVSAAQQAMRLRANCADHIVCGRLSWRSGGCSLATP